MTAAVLRVALLALTLAACRSVPVQDVPAAAAATPRETVQTVYSEDVGDPWNRLFSQMFTRTVQLRKTSEFGDAGPFVQLGESEFRRFPVSTRTFDRLEDGDRAVPPFYPSFIHMLGAPPPLTAERLEDFERTLADALADTRPRTPVDRVLMQADLWAVFDRLGPVDPRLPNRPRVLEAEIERVTPLLARMIARLALTRAEIAALPDQLVAQYTLTSLADLEQKLSQYSGGTRFTLDVTALDPQITPAVVTRITRVAEAHGLVLTSADVPGSRKR